MITAFKIILAHFVADFIFQDERWASGKSKNDRDLFSHTLMYSLLMTCFAYTSNGFYLYGSLLFGVITFIAHTATDYVTSRIVSKKFAKGEYGSSIPNFGGFTVIGFDQVLHYGQLFLTYHLIFQR